MKKRGFTLLADINKAASVFLLFLTGFLCSPVSAQGYPERPIEMTVSYSAGGGTDVIARIVAKAMSDLLGQQVLVVNRPGAGGAISVMHVVRSRPDGYSIGWFTGGPIILAPITEKNLQYNVSRDLIPVSLVQTTDQVLVARPGLKANTIPELISLAKSHPGEVTMGHTGNGTAQLLAAQMLEKQGGITLNKIPYKGEANMLTDMMGGRLDMGLITASSAEPLAQTGKIKLLSSGGAVRAHLFPKTPSMAESGFPKFDANSIMGIFVPAGTPKAVVEKLAGVARQVVQMPEIREKLQSRGGQPVGSTPQEFSAYLAQSREQAEKMLK